MPVPKKRIPFSQKDLQNLDDRIDENLCSPSNQLRSERLEGRQKTRPTKTAFDMVRDGTNLFDLPPGMVDSTVEDAQFLYSTQLFNDVLAKSLSTTQVPDAYDNLNAELREDDKQAIVKDEEFRRAINSISTAWNSLGVYRSDFNKTDNDKMARNAYIAMVEKAFLDYIGSVNWDVVDRNDGDRVDSAYDFMCEPNPQGSFRDVFVPSIRDMFRYDAGAIVKTFNRRKELIELKSYLGTEFWIEMDRVPQIISVPANDNAMGIRATDYSRGKGTGGNEVIMQGWWSRGFTWRYWQRSQTGVYIPYTPSEVCYLSLYKRSDDIYGTDYIKFLKYWIQYLIDSTVAAGKTFQNGMIPSLILNHPNIYDINQIQQRLTQLRFENQGPTRTGTVMHLVNGESAQTLAQKLHDMEWVEGQKFVAQLVWGYFGFPSDEFIGGDSNRAVAYVHRNVTKSRLLKPMMKYLEDKINREILPFLKGYKKSWEFRFIQEMELDDKQKVAQTGAVRMSSFISGLGPSFPGLPARYSQKLANDEALSKDELAEVDALIAEAKESMMMQEMGGDMGGGVSEDPLGDQEQGRYGQGSEMYQPVNVSDYGQGGENTEQRMGNKEEVEYQKSELQYEVGSVFHKAGKKYEIISNNGEFAKARIYVADVKDVPKGRSYKKGTRGGIYYIGTLAEKQQGEGNKRTPRGAVEAQPKNGNGGAGVKPASAFPKLNLGGNQLSREERIKRMKEEEQKRDKERYPARNPEYEENISDLKGLSDLMTSSAKGEDYAKYQTDKLPSEFIDQIDNNSDGRESLYSLLTPKNFETSAAYVREGKSGDEGLDEEIKTIDAMFNGSKNIPAGISLWRGVSGEYSDALNKLKEGDEISDKYYSSTSLSPERAFLYAKQNPKTTTPTMIRVLSNGSQKGMYVNKPVIEGSDEKEHEVVLPRNTRLKIVKKESMKLKDKTCNLITVTPA